MLPPLSLAGAQVEPQITRDEQSGSGPSTHGNCANQRHQRPRSVRPSGFCAADPPSHISRPRPLFSGGERGLPVWPLSLHLLCEPLLPAPGRRCFSRAWSAALFAFHSRHLSRALLCHGNNHHPPPFRGFCFHFPDGPRPVKSRLPFMCSHNIGSSQVNGDSRPPCVIICGLSPPTRLLTGLGLGSPLNQCLAHWHGSTRWHNQPGTSSCWPPAGLQWTPHLSL